MNRFWLMLPLLAPLAGCFDENVMVQDLRGVVRLPKEAATYTSVREVLDGNGDVVETIQDVVTDVRAIGPVYIGLYSSVENNLEAYPHPERGPSAGGGSGRGVSYPYGGTTIGDFRYACFEFFTCKLVSGRFETYQDIVDWFTEVVGDPPVDEGDVPIGTGEFIKQTCYQLLEVTSDEEVRITAYEDRNDDATIDSNDLDFIENGEFFEAEFIIRYAPFFEGMTAWAFLDQANQITFEHDTCDSSNGYFENTYNRRFAAGIPQADVLNAPFSYIDDEDWVASEGFIWNDPFERAELTIDLHVAKARGEEEGN